MANIAAIERTAGKGMRFLFAPQFLGRGSLQPVKNILIIFVQMMAQFLASAELIPANHRALRPVSGSDARLGEVLALACHNLRRPGTRLDQYAVFGGVFALMSLLAIMAIYTVSSMLLGSAHAAITITFSIGTPCATAGTLFQSNCAGGDMAQQWIDALLLGQAPWWLGQTTLISPAMQAGLGAMFNTYSMAMLVLAGFLVLYHLLMIIAGTAHEGRFGGRAMNQIWAPIRLVAAIGMLVPVGVNGLNSGQLVAIQVTKWGSALASNTWIAFANTFTNSPYVILPPLPATVPALREALFILVCEKSYTGAARDIEAAYGTLPFTVEPTPWYKTTGDGLKIAKNWEYQSTTTADHQNSICGDIEMLNPDYAPSGVASEFLSSATGLTASLDIRKAVLEVQRDAIDDAMQSVVGPGPNYVESGSVLAQLADKIYRSADAVNTGVTLSVTDILNFNQAVMDYRAALASGIRTAVVSSTALAGMNMTTDAISRGWMSAGVWFNSIAKINGMLIDYAKAIPNVQHTYKQMLAPRLTARAQTALASAADVVAQLPDMAGQLGTPVAEPLSYLSQIDGSSPMDQYLLDLANRIKGILGNQTGSADEIAAGALPAYASGLSLNSANPLAELAALGHRMVEASFATNNAVGACYESLNNERERQSNADTAMGPADGFNHDCSSGSGTQPGPAMFLMQAVSGAMVMAGITLAFVLPLLPFVRFLFGTLTWIIAVFETVIAVPIVALAHIRMDGDGFTGSSARSAYMLLLQVFLRPVLMVFGLMVALLVFNLMIVALNEFYSQAVRSAEGGGSMSALAAVVYTVIYVSLAYGLANASFKAIDMVPNQCLMWIGGATQQGVDGTQYVSQGASQTAGIARTASSSLADMRARSLAYNRV